MRFNLENIGNVISWQTNEVVQSEQINYKSRIVTAYLNDNKIYPEDKVLIYHGGDASFFIDLFGVWGNGSCAVCLNPNLTESELQNIIDFVKPKLLLGKQASFENLDLNINCLDTSTLSEKNVNSVNESQSKLDDDALILFTSGTTGTPKGVVHTFRSLISRIALNQSNIPNDIMNTTLCVLPMHFGHGLIGNCLTPLLAGSDLVLAPGTNLYVTNELGKIIDDHKITFMSSVPTLWKKVISKSEQPKLGTLKRVHIGSAPLSSDLWLDVIKWADTCDIVNIRW